MDLLRHNCRLLSKQRQQTKHSKHSNCSNCIPVLRQIPTFPPKSSFPNGENCIQHENRSSHVTGPPSRRDLRAIERFEAASNEFNESCQTIRQALPRESRFVANIMHQHYLVTSDSEGNFEVESVDTV